MSARVPVLVLCDANGNYFGASGQIFTINTTSIVRGVIKKPSKKVYPASVNVTFVDTLEVEDTGLGTLFLLMTLTEYQQAATIAQTNGGSPSGEASGALTGQYPDPEIALEDGRILVGNIDGIATSVPVSGDVSITNLGVVTIEKYINVLFDLTGDGLTQVYQTQIPHGYRYCVGSAISTQSDLIRPYIYFADIPTDGVLRFGIVDVVGNRLPLGLIISSKFIISK